MNGNGVIWIYFSFIVTLYYFNFILFFYNFFFVLFVCFSLITHFTLNCFFCFTVLLFVTCEYCAKSFTSRTTLLRHQKFSCSLSQRTAPLLPCLQCDFSCRRPDALKAHILRHSNRSKKESSKTSWLKFKWHSDNIFNLVNVISVRENKDKV